MYENYNSSNTPIDYSRDCSSCNFSSSQNFTKPLIDPSQNLNQTMKIIAQFVSSNPLLKTYFQTAKVKCNDVEVMKIQLKLIDDTETLIYVTIAKKNVPY
jgi:hypothetical protein